MKKLAEEVLTLLTESRFFDVRGRAADVGLKLIFKGSWYKLMARPGTVIGRIRVIFPRPVAASVRLRDIEKWLDDNEKKVRAKRY